MEDNVNKPKHYCQGKIEVIDFILDQKMGYLESNITKYICRYKYKNGLEDLLKAKWYLEKLISIQRGENYKGPIVPTEEEHFDFPKTKEG